MYHWLSSRVMQFKEAGNLMKTQIMIWGVGNAPQHHPPSEIQNALPSHLENAWDCCGKFQWKWWSPTTHWGGLTPLPRFDITVQWIVQKLIFHRNEENWTWLYTSMLSVLEKMEQEWTMFGTSLMTPKKVLSWRKGRGYLYPIYNFSKSCSLSGKHILKPRILALTLVLLVK